jgi:hypothetical protein
MRTGVAGMGSSALGSAEVAHQLILDLTLDQRFERAQQEAEFGMHPHLARSELDAASHAAATKVQGITVPFRTQLEFTAEFDGGFCHYRAGRLERSTMTVVDIDGCHDGRFRRGQLCYDAARIICNTSRSAADWFTGGGVVRALALILALIPSWSALAATIEGHIDLFAEGKPLRAEEAQDSIVYFRPKVPLAAIPILPTQVMSTLRKQFVPRVLATTVGSAVRFPNQDPILHNAFSTSKDNAFDVGLYGQGEGQAVTFSHVGYVRVYCNVHHSMIGHILVLDTPYFVRPDANGDFRLVDVPAAEGDLVIWSERAPPWHEVIHAGADGPIRVKLELTQRRIPTHMNKFGKPYGRASDGGY